MNSDIISRPRGSQASDYRLYINHCPSKQDYNIQWEFSYHTMKVNAIVKARVREVDKIAAGDWHLSCVQLEQVKWGL